MESTLSPEKTIEYISQPAFLVENGVVASVNEAAAHMHIKVNIPIIELIKEGAEEYESFKSGRLYLALTIGRAWVSICDNTHLFCLEDPYSSPELKALALAAQSLRTPLSNAMSGLDLLKQNEALLESETLREQVGSINKSIYNLLRAVSNMSDASAADLTCKANLQIQNATSVFHEIFEKLSDYVAQTGRTLKWNSIHQAVECAIDRDLMERAILNAVSNAIKFSPDGSTITATVKEINNRLSVTIENPIAEDQLGMYSSCFQQYRRMPTLENGLSGIGLGLSVISGVMAAHLGTVLMDSSRKNTARISLSFPIRTNVNPLLRSDILLLGGYTGGIDSYLLELSDVLPNHNYE